VLRWNYLEGGPPADGFDQANVERAKVHQGESSQEEVGDQQGDRVKLSCHNHQADVQLNRTNIKLKKLLLKTSC
jgi:hypothetical protein